MSQAVSMLMACVTALPLGRNQKSEQTICSENAGRKLVTDHRLYVNTDVAP